MPSVTEIIDYLKEPELVKWIENNSKAKRKSISDESLRVGNKTDMLVQQDVRGECYKVDASDIAVVNCMKAWESWKKDYPEVFKGIIVDEMQRELRIRMDDGEEIIGHPDLPIMLKDRWGILDVKSSKSIWPNNYTQDAIYTEMKKIEDNIVLPRFIGLLHLKKETGTYVYIPINDEKYIQYEVSVFKARYICYQHALKNREQIRKQLEEELV